MKIPLRLLQVAAVTGALALAQPSASEVRTMGIGQPVSDIAIRFLCVTDSLKNCTDIVFTTQPWHVMFEVVNLGEKPVNNWSFDIFIGRPGTPLTPIKQQISQPPLQLGESRIVNWPGPFDFGPNDKGPWHLEVAIQVKDPGNPDADPSNNRALVPFEVQNKPLVSDIAIASLCVTDSLKQCTDVVFTTQPWHTMFDVKNVGQKQVDNWSFAITLVNGTTGQAIPIKTQVPAPPLPVGQFVTINWPGPEFASADKGPWRIEVKIQVKDPGNPDADPSNNGASVPFTVENKPAASDIAVRFACVTDSLKNCSSVVFTQQPWHTLFEVVNLGDKPVNDWSFDILLAGAGGVLIPVKQQVPGPPLPVGGSEVINWPGPFEFDASQKGQWTVTVSAEIKEPGNPDIDPNNNHATASFVVENKPLVTDIGITFLCVTDSLKNCTNVVFVGQEWHVLFDVVNKGEKPVLDWSFDIVLTGGAQSIPIKTQIPGPPLDVGQAVRINWPSDFVFDPSHKGTGWQVFVEVRVKEPSNPDTNLVNNRRAVTFVVENKPQVTDIGIASLCVTDSTKMCTDLLYTTQPWHILFSVVNKGEKPVTDWSFDILLQRAGQIIPVKTQIPGPPLDLGQTVTINWEGPFEFGPEHKGPWQLMLHVEVKEADNPDTNQANNRRAIQFVVENKPLVSDIGITFLCVTDTLKNCTDVVFVRQPWHILFDVVNKGEKPVLDWSFDIRLGGAADIPIKTQIPGPPLDVGQSVRINWPAGFEFTENQKGTTWQLFVEVQVKEPGNPDTNLVNNRRFVTFVVENKPEVSDIAVPRACVTLAPDAIDCVAFFDRQAFHQFNLSQGKARKGIETFEEGVITSKEMFPAPLGPDPNPPVFPNGLEQRNLIIQDNITPGPSPRHLNPSGNPAALYAIPPGFLGSNSIKVGEDLFLKGIHASLDLIFTEPNHTGIGFSLSHFSGFPTGGWSIAVYNKANELMAEYEVPGDGAIEPSKAFFGVWCSETIGRINIYDKAGVAPDAIDDIEMWIGGPTKQCTDTIFVKLPWHIMFEVVNVGEKPVDDWSFDIVLSRPGGVAIPLKTQVAGPPLAVGQSVVINWPSPRRFSEDEKGPWRITVTATVKDPNNPDGDPTNNQFSFGFMVENHPLTDVGELASGDLRMWNAPNPFGPSTTVHFELPRDGPVDLDVYDVNGRLVRRLVHGARAAGRNSVIWDGTDASGNRVSAGVYLYRISAAGLLETRRMVLMP